MRNDGRRFKVVKVKNGKSLTTGILGILVSVVFALAAITSGNYTLNFAIAATSALIGTHYVSEGLGKITNIDLGKEKTKIKK